jgi:hypothetical protein
MQLQTMIETEASVAEIATQIALFAAAVFHEKCPDDWRSAMTALVTTINQHVAENVEHGTS